MTRCSPCKAALLVLALAALPSAASAQQTAAKKYADVGGWTINSYSVDGAYIRCGAVAPGVSGALTSFEKSSEGWTLLVRTGAKGDSVKGSVDIDGRSFAGEFHRMDDNRIGVFLTSPQVKMVQGGKTMLVKIGAEQTAVPLAGIPAVHAKVAACDRKG